jgi:hypothetical protein
MPGGLEQRATQCLPTWQIEVLPGSLQLLVEAGHHGTVENPARRAACPACPASCPSSCCARCRRCRCRCFCCACCCCCGCCSCQASCRGPEALDQGSRHRLRALGSADVGQHKGAVGLLGVAHPARACRGQHGQRGRRRLSRGAVPAASDCLRCYRCFCGEGCPVGATIPCGCWPCSLPHLHGPIDFHGSLPAAAAAACCGASHTCACACAGQLCCAPLAPPVAVHKLGSSLQQGHIPASGQQPRHRSSRCQNGAGLAEGPAVAQGTRHTRPQHPLQTDGPGPAPQSTFCEPRVRLLCSWTAPPRDSSLLPGQEKAIGQSFPLPQGIGQTAALPQVTFYRRCSPAGAEVKHGSGAQRAQRAS